MFRILTPEEIGADDERGGCVYYKKRNIKIRKSSLFSKKISVSFITQ